MSKFVHRPIATFLTLLLLSLPLFAQGHQPAGPTGRKAFSTSGTLIVPNGITSVVASLFCAGAGTGKGDASHTAAVLSVSPGAMLIVTVGGTSATDTSGDTYVTDAANKVLAVVHGGGNLTPGQTGFAVLIWAKESPNLNGTK
jgi:hypothetical protein